MITTPIFTRLMTTSEYGQFSVFNSWFGIINIIVSLGLYQGVHAQGLIKFDNEPDLFTSSLEGLTTTLVCFWIVIYLFFQNYWNKLFALTTVQMLCMLVMIWTSAVYAFWANKQRVTYSYRSLVVVTLAVSIAKPFLEIIIMNHSKDKVTARILGIFLVELIGFSWIFIAQMKRGKTFFSKRFWKYALAFNIPLVPHYLSQTVLNSSDRIMIQKIVGESEAGIYSLAYSLSLIMTLFNSALLQTISPWMYQKIKVKQNKEIAPIAYISLIIIAGVNLILILLAPEILIFFAPNSYYEAIWVIPPVAMSVYFMYAYDMFAKFAFYYEKTKFIMIASVLGAGLNIILNYFGIRAFGYIAAGYTTLICYIVYSIAHYLFMIRVCDKCCDSVYPYDSRKLFLITISFILGGFVLLFTYKIPIVRYGIVILLLFFSIIKRDDLKLIVKKLLNLRKQNT